MGAKRAVPGRSLPYDILLASYQKKNQAKQQSRLSLFIQIHLYFLFEERLETAYGGIYPASRYKFSALRGTPKIKRV